MRLIRLVLLLLLSASNDAYAAEVLQLADGQSASVRVSAHALTRIAMANGGRVAKVIGLESEVSVEPDEEAGQVFIRPTPGRSQAFTLHVRDDSGATYTLLAVPAADMAGDTVFIRPAGRRRPARDAVSSPQEPRIAHIKRWLRLLGRGGVPDGATLERVHQRLAPRQGFELILVGRVVGTDCKAEIYTLRNVSDAELNLNEADFQQLGERLYAIALESRQLVSGQRTRLFVLQANE